MMVSRNIVLIGMPSSGKSTIGKYLAQMLRLEFVDTDALIKENTGKELRDIVNEEGLDQFLEIQEKTILRLNMRGCVIATGGSVIYSRATMDHLRHIGCVIYLKLDFSSIEKRVVSGRRFARNHDQSLYDLYNERTPLYEKYAEVVVDCSNKQVEEIADEISKLVKRIDQC